MGLYINHGKHPKVYKNNRRIQEPNQAYSRQDSLTEIISEQQKAFVELSISLAELNQRFLLHESKQNNQWNQVDQQLSVLRENAQKQKNFDNQMITSFQTISEKNLQIQSILENVATQEQAIITHVDLLNESIQKIAAQLDKHEQTNQQLSQKMEEQLALQQDVTEKLNKQEVIQGDVIMRLETQEAISEKIVRQINHIRSILFERTNFLASKIENGCKVTSAYVYKLITGSDQPLTFFALNQKKGQEAVQQEEKESNGITR